jgi:hypothetical protein
LRAAIGTRGGYCWWDVDYAGWVVTLSSLEQQTFYGRSKKPSPGVWLMAKGTPGDWGLGTGHPKGLDWGHEIGVGPFLV